MTQLADWLESHTGRAPAVLAERVREHALTGAGATSHAGERWGGRPGRQGGRDARPTTAGATSTEQDALARAAGGALDRVVAQPGDRSVALDLLAADALITLALLAQAESAPERLGDFAASLLRSERPGL